MLCDLSRHSFFFHVSLYVAHIFQELMVLLPPRPICWNYCYVSHHLDMSNLGIFVCIFIGAHVCMCTGMYVLVYVRVGARNFVLFWGRVYYCLKLTNYDRLDVQWTIGILLPLPTQCWKYKSMSSAVLFDWAFTP